jgi:N-acetylglucosaminyl-diphospho-decaprenol L-rhamnosyltransferase
MVVSVLIVNYRVRYFLELCLHSLQRTLTGLDAEIIVVDNNSGDDGIAALRPLFPDVIFLENSENEGFAKANNRAFGRARGEYILFLNPDTIVPEDLAPSCLAMLASTPGIGGLGVRMVDGSGRFLKESRRGFPTPWVAFCKMTGLTALFPRSRAFASYYLGHLPDARSHPAPVLSGACLWVSRAALEKTGAFDERFFLYAEDIDLSYRLEKAGYTNYYYPGVTIIHFKGESTQKDIRYTRQFYRAMSQFRQKHFQRRLPAVFNAGLEVAIWLRAAIGALPVRAGRTGKNTPGNRRTNKQASRNTWLEGDPAEVRSFAALLAASGKRKVAEDIHKSQEIIFCQGADYSFRDCIAGLEANARHRNGQQIKFHAAGAGIAVGSADPNGRGDILVI